MFATDKEGQVFNTLILCAEHFSPMTPHQTPQTPFAKFAPLIGIGFMGFACVLAVKLASQRRFGFRFESIESISKCFAKSFET